MVDNATLEDSVQVGQVYKEKNGSREVLPHFVDLHSGVVNFSDVGRSNEDRTSSSDFLNRFTFQGAAKATNDVVAKEDLPEKEPDEVKKGF